MGGMCVCVGGGYTYALESALGTMKTKTTSSPVTLPVLVTVTYAKPYKRIRSNL